MTTHIRPILVAYDGSQEADTALDWAAQTALATHVPVRVVIVESTDLDRLAATGLLMEPESGLVQEDLRTTAEHRLKGAGVDDVVVDVVEGRIVPVLVEQAGTASMVVVGSNGHGRAAGALLGSVSQHLARHAPCPVVVTRPPARPTADRIVVGVDGSEGSQAAIEFAYQRAEITGERIVVLNAWHNPRLLGDAGRGPRPLVGQDIQARELLLSESVAGIASSHPDVPLETTVLLTRPAQALADASMTASLVVVGSRGLGAFGELLLGSVSSEVLHRAHCPVAIVR